MKPEFFAANRRHLIQKLHGGLVVLAAYGRVQRSNDSAHAFTQEANFWYLTGIEDPDWLLIIDGSQSKTVLVAPDISDVHRIFDGGLTYDEAKRMSGADKVVDHDEGMSLLRVLAKRHSLVYTVDQPAHAEQYNFTLNPSIAKHRLLLERMFNQVQDCRKELAILRSIKQEAEVALIQKAVDITIHAFNEVKQGLTSYRHEYEIDATFSYQMRLKGAAGHAYDPIIAAGGNACTLHYSRNNAPLHSRELVLMDVGASYQGYAADITRTFIRGAATKRQAEVHAAVEEAHHKIITMLAPHLSVEDYQRQVDVIMSDALRRIGLYENETSLRRYFPHAVSHGLGIDVHDSLGGPNYLSEGMVLTVEPGIYIPEESIGVRIEDDILITASGNRNLSRKLSTGM